MNDLSSPAGVMGRLCEIENSLAMLQNKLEDAALDYFRAKRDREKKWAEEFIGATGTDGQRKAAATVATAHIGVEAEGKWEGLKKVVTVLDARRSIGQSLLNTQAKH